LTFADIAGLETVKETLMQRVVFPLRFPDKLEKYGITGGGGMLLYGPPGTGKTLLVRAVAGELGLPFFVIKSSEVLSQYYGQSEKQLADLFAEARSQPNGAVMFLDEIDAIGAKRTDQMNEASRRVLNQLLQELDGVDDRSRKLVFFAATNEPWLLDTALLRPPRFSERCYVPLPDGKARRVLFEMGLRNCPIGGDVSFDSLVARSEGLSGADIANLCERAKLIPFTESIRTGKDRPLLQRDIDESMQNVKPSVSPEDVRRYETVFGGEHTVLASDNEVVSLENSDIDVVAITNTIKKFGFNEKEAKQKLMRQYKPDSKRKKRLSSIFFASGDRYSAIVM
jgi:transitional endoplasmic reticulum ATPase